MAQTIEPGTAFRYIGTETVTVSDCAAEAIAQHDTNCLYQSWCGATENALEAGIELTFAEEIDWAGQYLADGTTSCYCHKTGH